MVAISLQKIEETAPALVGPYKSAGASLHRHGIEVELGRFTLLGLLTVPATVAASTAALWGALRVIGA